MAWVDTRRPGLRVSVDPARPHRSPPRMRAAAISAESGMLFRAFDEARRAERAAGRAAERAAWESERDGLAEAERRTIEADAAYGELADAAMFSAGYHRPGRGRWRRRRHMATEFNATDPGTPLVSPAEMGTLLDRIDRSEGEEQRRLKDHLRQGTDLLLKWAKEGDARALPALRALLARRPDQFGRLGFWDFAAKAAAMAAAGPKDVLVRDLFTGEIEATADELAGPDPTPWSGCSARGWRWPTSTASTGHDGDTRPS